MTEDLRTFRDLEEKCFPKGLTWRKRKAYLSKTLHLGKMKRRLSASHPLRWTLTWRKRRNFIQARPQPSPVVTIAASARFCRLRRYRSVRGRHFMRIKFRHAGPQWVRWLVRRKDPQRQQYQEWLGTVAPLLSGGSKGRRQTRTTDASQDGLASALSQFLANWTKEQEPSGQRTSGNKVVPQRHVDKDHQLARRLIAILKECLNQNYSDKTSCSKGDART